MTEFNKFYKIAHIYYFDQSSFVHATKKILQSNHAFIYIKEIKFVSSLKYSTFISEKAFSQEYRGYTTQLIIPTDEVRYYFRRN